MIEQTAIVLAVADGSALVEVRRASGCAACQVGEHCGTAAVAKLFDKAGHTRLRLADPIGLAPGDRILIGIPDPVLIRASLTAYLLPLLALIMVAGAAEQAGPRSAASPASCSDSGWPDDSLAAAAPRPASVHVSCDGSPPDAPNHPNQPARPPCPKHP